MTSPTDVMRTVHIGTVDGQTVTADRYEDDPPVVALLETPGGVAHEWTPDVARAIGHLLIAGAAAAGAIAPPAWTSPGPWRPPSTTPSAQTSQEWLDELDGGPEPTP